MKNNKILIGTRSSKLALYQSKLVQSKLEELYPNLSFILKKIKTKGDKLINEPLESSIEKGFFVKEIQQSLLNNDIDIAVHSLKDLPVDVPNGLKLTAILKRGNHRDSLLARYNVDIYDQTKPLVIATSSNRRKSQLLRLNPSLKVKSIRGNIDTRISKMNDGYCDALVVATAALERLGISDKIFLNFSSSQMISAPAQGAIAVETRAGDKLGELIKKLDHQTTRICVNQERLFLKTLKGGCTAPIGAHSTIHDNNIIMKVIVSSLDGKKFITKELKSEYISTTKIGLDLANLVLKSGGREILSEI